VRATRRAVNDVQAEAARLLTVTLSAAERPSGRLQRLWLAIRTHARRS
jgi:hypothetical protein